MFPLELMEATSTCDRVNFFAIDFGGLRFDAGHLHLLQGKPINDGSCREGAVGDRHLRGGIGT